MKDEPDLDPPLHLSFISVHLLTCPRRADACAATLARWDATDWGRQHGRPRIHLDDAEESPDEPWGDARRHARVVAAYRRMLADATTLRGLTAEQQRAVSERGRDAWLLFLEDDLDFHPRIGAAVASWQVVRLPHFRMLSLFNPGLREVKLWPDGEIAGEGPPPTDPYPRPAVRLLRHLRHFPADPLTFLGAQALLLRRSFVRASLAQWDALRGMQSQRLAKLHVRLDSVVPILVHRPSLVQHVPVEGAQGESAWGARVQRALDFDPSWSPPPPPPDPEKRPGHEGRRGEAR